LVWRFFNFYIYLLIGPLLTAGWNFMAGQREKRAKLAGKDVAPEGTPAVSQTGEPPEKG
jgi:hypothetical protein